MTAVTKSEPLEGTVEGSAGRGITIAPTTPTEAQEFAATIRYAIEAKADPAVLKEMMLLRQQAIEFTRKIAREDRDEDARRAFVAAMSAFRGEPIKIEKGTTVDYETAKGRTHYKHADLAAVVNAVIGPMSKHGLRHTWKTRQAEGRIFVTCVVEHSQGGAEQIELNAAPDDSGGKNAIQSIGSAISYLQRYTLLAILGLATQGEDNDGRGADDDEPAECAMLNAIYDQLDTVKTGAQLHSVRDKIEKATAEELPDDPRKLAIGAYNAKATELKNKPAEPG